MTAINITCLELIISRLDLIIARLDLIASSPLRRKLAGFTTSINAIPSGKIRRNIYLRFISACALSRPTLFLGRQRPERLVRLRLVPVGNRGHIVLTLEQAFL